MLVGNIQTKRSGALTVAYVSTSGPYYEIPALTRQLFRWMERKYLQRAGLPVVVFLDRPAGAHAQTLKMEVWCPVAPNTAEMPPDEDGMGVKKVAAQEVVAALSKGDFAGVKADMDSIEKWMKERGYNAAGPWQQAYVAAVGKSPGEVATEIRVPARKR